MGAGNISSHLGKSLWKVVLGCRPQQVLGEDVMKNASINGPDMHIQDRAVQHHFDCASFKVRKTGFWCWWLLTCLYNVK